MIKNLPAKGKKLQHYLIALQTVRFFLLRAELHGVCRTHSLSWLLVGIQNLRKASRLQQCQGGP